MVWCDAGLLMVVMVGWLVHVGLDFLLLCFCFFDHKQREWNLTIILSSLVRGWSVSMV